MHTQLKQRFPGDRINKAQTYLYFISLKIGVDAFIYDKKITLKYTFKGVDEYTINRLDGLLKLSILDTKVELRQRDDYEYWTWDIDLKSGSLSEVSRILQAVRIIA